MGNAQLDFKVIKLANTIVTHDAVVFIQAVEFQTVKLVITDLNGSKLKSLRYSLQPGDNSIHFAAGDLANGIYIIHIISDLGKSRFIRFLKL